MNESDQFVTYYEKYSNATPDDYFNDIDTSEYPFPNTLWHIKSAPEIALKSSLMVIVCATGIYLNFVILLIIIRNRFLWTATNFLVGNLALMDLLTLLLCPWPWLVRDFFQSYVLGFFGCRFEAFLQTSFLLATVGAVVLVSYDRLASAALTMEARVNKSGAKKLIYGSWFMAVLLSAPWIFNREYIQRQWLDYLEAYCMEGPFIHVYWHIVVTILVWVPIGLMIVTYGGIMWRIERSARKLKGRGGGHLVGRARGKAMRITACILIMAAACRLPYTAMVYWRNNLQPVVNSVSHGYNKMWFAANCLIYVSSAINPLIYGFTNERFRRAMDRTPGVACCKFGAWCCVCKWNVNKKTISEEDKNVDKIFVIGSTPKLEKKIPYLIKNILHIHRDTLEFIAPKSDECTNKQTRITPLNELI